MRNSNTITMFNGSVTVNKIKLDETLSMICCAALYVARILLFIATGIFGLLTIVAGGDGRVDDGDPTTMFISLGLALMCALGARLAGMFMDAIVHGARRRNMRRKHAHMCKNTNKTA